MAGLRYLPVLLLPIAAGAADSPFVNGVRLGEHRDFTRVVVDFKGKDAPYSIRVSDDGLSVSIIAKAAGADGTLPPKKLGLVRDVQWRSVTNGLVVTFATGATVAVKSHGALTPDSSSHFYRIYVDLAPGAAPGPTPFDPEPAVAQEPAAPADAPPIALAPAAESKDPEQ